MGRRRATARGDVTPGELVALYGYAAFLTSPLRMLVETADKYVRALVAARRLITLLEVPASVVDRPGAAATSPGGTLADPESGVTAAAGRLTAVVCDPPEDAAVLARRLARFDDDTRATFGGVPLRDLSVAEVRARVLLAEDDAQLFSGTIREQVDPEHVHDDAEVLAALEVADARDVLDLVDGGLAGTVTERGRSLSGGQRQRLALAACWPATPRRSCSSSPRAPWTPTPRPASPVACGGRARAHHGRRDREPARPARGGRRLLGPRRPRRRHRPARRPAGHRPRLPRLRHPRRRRPRSGHRARTPDPPPHVRGAPVRTTLPVADREHVLRDVRRLLREHRDPGLRMLALHALAAVAGLTGPFLLGRLVDDVVGAVRDGTAFEVVARRIDVAVAVLVAAVVAQAVLARLARKRSLVLAEGVFAQLREEFLTRATALPLSVVEQAGTGDLVSRTTNDVDALSYTVRYGAPAILVAFVTSVLTVVAAVFSGPLVALAILAGFPGCSSRPAGTCAGRRRGTPPNAPSGAGSPRRWARTSRTSAPSRRSAWPSTGCGSSTTSSARPCAASATRCPCAPCGSRASRCPTSCPWSSHCCGAVSSSGTTCRRSAR